MFANSPDQQHKAVFIVRYIHDPRKGVYITWYVLPFRPEIPYNIKPLQRNTKLFRHP